MFRGVTDGETIGALLAERAQQTPDKTFLILPDDGKHVTFGEMYQDARQLAWGLMELGLSPGDRIALANHNSAEAVASWFACLLGGFVDTAVNPEAAGAPLQYSLEKVGAAAVITQASHLAVVSDASANLPQQPQIICADWAERSQELARAVDMPVHDLRDVGANARPTSLREAGTAELASIRFTSGSTGLPKGIMMSQGHMRASAQMFGGLTELSADDVLYSCFPLHHVLASITGVLAALEAGCTMSLASHFSASRFWKQIRDCGATVAHNLDPVISILMKRSPDPSEDANNVRCMYTAAGNYPEFEERFGTRLIPLFDMSELTVVAHYRPGQERRPGSCGQESDLFTVAIADERDCLVDPGTVGQIVVRPKMPNVMYLGYYGDEGRTVEQWQNLWYHTGDMGFLDEDGFLHFTGRSVDRIRRKGVNVSAEQIEAIVLERPEISECAAIAVPSDISEDEIKVCISLIPGAQVTVEELGEWVTKVLPGQLRPRYIEIYSSLPRTDTSKIRKSVLRANGDHGLSGQTWDISRRGYVPVAARGALSAHRQTSTSAHRIDRRRAVHRSRARHAGIDALPEHL